ncbi:SAM-dependent DNA methyltransferase, partial [Acinetobacter baumannii]|nr:SAM-dependent DNA methyltransferase [Acinetobacter baumannii]
GFLVAASEYLNDHYSTEIFANPEAAKRFSEQTFFGYDFDSTMLRIGSMNMMLHGVENPRIENRDSLSEAHSHIESKYSLILANPPFAGSLDNESCAKNIQAVVKTKKTELLFLALFLRLLKTGGRAAVIVPDGVLFGSSKAHKDLRQKIVEEQKLEAIISMPSGVFKPYAGVSTAIMIFTKTMSGGTDKVWFYDMQADGYSLDDKRNELDASKHENNNIPDIIARFKNLEGEKGRKATEQSFMVDKADIAANGYDLSINRYKEVVYEQVEYEAPSKILADLEELEQDILKGMATLKELLK